MATWKPTNSKLTEKGVEILNKVSVGSGKLQISKILAADGSVAESALYSSTSLAGTTHQMSLSKVVARLEGSEVSFYISNDGISSPFHLRQIGIFVSHPDYEGDVLFHISQCDEAGHDVIPVSDGNVTNYGYTVYFSHSNNVNVSFTVSPTGCIQKVQNSTVGELPVLTKDGDLTPSGTHLADVLESIENSMKKGENIVLVQGVHYGNSLPTGEDDLRRPVGSIFFKKVTG